MTIIFRDGELVELTAEEAALLPPPGIPAKTAEDICDAIDAERDRRVSTRFQHGGVWYQCRPADVVNLTGAGASALASLVTGQPWPSDFQWIAEDNSRVPMGAGDVVALGNAYTAFRSGLIFRASDLKARVRAGETVDWSSDAAWTGPAE